jgi:hypothetical protein
VAFALGPLAVLAAARLQTAADADHGRGGEDALQAAVGAPGAVQVAADASRVPGCGSQPGEGGQPVWAAEAGHLAAGGGEELCPRVPIPGRLAITGGELVPVKAALEQLVEVADLPVEGDHLPSQRGHELGGEALARQRHRLLVGGRHRRGGELVGGADLAVARPDRR